MFECNIDYKLDILDDKTSIEINHINLNYLEEYEDSIKSQFALIKSFSVIRDNVVYNYRLNRKKQYEEKRYEFNWSDLIDFIAIDFIYDGKCFAPQFVSFTHGKKRNKSHITFRTDYHKYSNIAVKVIDKFSNNYPIKILEYEDN